MFNRIRDTWRRLSEGLTVQELWTQFRKETTASYRLYTKELDAREQGERKGRTWWRNVKAITWSILDKLSPTRRIILVLALVLTALGRVEFAWGSATFSFSFRGWGFLLILLLLVLELADRVTMKRDMEIAREIQRWLLPHQAPSVPETDMAFATHPANTVAGDYFDVFLRQPDGIPQDRARLLLAIADVAGKSVPAALLMATLQSSLRTVAYEDVALPELVGRLNRYACDHSLEGRRFTTAVIAELDPKTGELTYVNAGHNPPLLRRPGGSVTRLEAAGIPLGIQIGSPHEARSVTLGRGDLLVMYTDGIVEAENEQRQEYGEERLEELIRTLPAGSASDAVDRILASVERFIGTAPQTDDITCFVVRYTGSS